MKLIKNDYPFAIMYEDKISNNTGKVYSAISVSHTSVKNKDATDKKDKYDTKYLNFFQAEDLLKLATLCMTAYGEIKEKKNKEREEVRARNAHTEKPDEAKAETQPEPQDENNGLDDEIPF